MKLQTIYKQTKTGATQQWSIEVDGNKYRSFSGQVGGQITTSEWTIVAGKNTGKANQTTDSEQAMAEAVARRTKKLESGYFVDINHINQQQYFEPMLAAKWEDQKHKVTYPLYSQPKLDGIRCIVKEDGMWTRTGKPIDSAPHIFEYLAPLFANDPDLIFDGELYADKYANDFNAIVSLVKKTKPTAQDLLDSAKSIQYHIYDLPSNNGIFMERMKQLWSIKQIDPSTDACCTTVETNLIEHEQDVDMMYQNYIQAQYEGQMLRTNALYENKRSKSLLKHKSFIDSEYTIVGYEEGNGNLAGMIGALVFQTEKGDRFTASVNGGWDHLTQLWLDRETLIGQQATVKYFNITPDGKPRFPKVTAIRNYE